MLFRPRLSLSVSHLLLPAVLLTGCAVSHAQQTPAPAASASDDPIARIKDEGLNHSHVMQTLSYLTDVIGPRLTGSPSMKRANEWTRDQLTDYGLQNAHLEAWGPFGRGWELERFSAQLTAPYDIPLIAYPKAWSPGLKEAKGPHVGEVMYVDAKTEEDLAKYQGKLKGAIVLNAPIRDIPAHFEAMGSRYTDEQLKTMEEGRPRVRPAGAPGAAGGPNAGGPNAGGPNGRPDLRAQLAFNTRKTRFYQEEGVALIVDPSPRGDGGTVFVQSATVPQPVPAVLPGAPGGRPNATPPAGAVPAGAAAAPPVPNSASTGTPAALGTTVAPPTAANGDMAATAPRRRRAPGTAPARRISPWDKNAPVILPQIVVATEQYNRMVRMIQQGEKLKMAVDLSVKFYDKDLMAYNTVAEIPGSDLKDQIVMLGAHMDSWHSGTGATDNAAGDAVCMEAVRILKALNLQPRRTIRIALWSGEEEGLYGSSAYVAQHFAERKTTAGAPAPTFGGGGGGRGGFNPADYTLKPEHEKLSGYFNLDNGTGKIRGIYLQGNEGVRPIFREWLAPFKDMGASTITPNNTGSTDHVSFDGVGLPGFQFIQDEIEYNARTHHSNQDVYDRIQADDMKQASIIMAAFIYNTAMRDELLPRKLQSPPAPTTAAVR